MQSTKNHKTYITAPEKSHIEKRQAIQKTKTTPPRLQKRKENEKERETKE